MPVIKQPKSEVKLTNVAYVRYKKKNKKFEIACYKNKVMDWRNKVEKDLDNVLQIEDVFNNVSRGIKASNEDLMKVFNTTDRKSVCRFILDKGILQVSHKERTKILDTKMKEIINLIVSKCINLETNKPFPYNIVENSLKNELHYKISNNKASKQQALEIIKLLQNKKILPIEKAKMKVKILIPNVNQGKKMKNEIIQYIDTVEKELFINNYVLFAIINPGNYRIIQEFILKNTKGKGSVQVTETSVISNKDEEL